MALNKVTYTDLVTVIGAGNLNDIQDAVISLEGSRTSDEAILNNLSTAVGENTDSIGDLSDLTTTVKTDLVSAINEAAESGGSSVPSSVRQAMLTLFESAAYAETGLTDEIAVIESWATEVTSLSISPTTLTLNGSTPQSITATVVPSGSTVTWSSSDTSIATVVGGVVTGVSNGTCTITASAGDLSATCEVTVAGFATLSSISAVYTQSGTVYDTDSLDSLKADLVVTATYSDSSTATVPSTDYTLSGTLAEGTSTITVSYGGKTTTFTVTVSSNTVTISGWENFDHSTRFRTADAIDARDKALYVTVPYVSEFTGFATGVTATTNCYRMLGICYNDAECTDLAGYYYGGNLNTSYSVINVPQITFDTQYQVVATGLGYYVKIALFSNGSSVFTTNANAEAYLDSYVTSATIE